MKAKKMILSQVLKQVRPNPSHLPLSNNSLTQIPFGYEDGSNNQSTLMKEVKFHAMESNA